MRKCSRLYKKRLVALTASKICERKVEVGGQAREMSETYSLKIQSLASCHEAIMILTQATTDSRFWFDMTLKKNRVSEGTLIVESFWLVDTCGLHLPL